MNLQRKLQEFSEEKDHNDVIDFEFNDNNDVIDFEFPVSLPFCANPVLRQYSLSKSKGVPGVLQDFQTGCSCSVIANTNYAPYLNIFFNFFDK